VQQCEQTYSSDGEICKCVAEPTDQGEPSGNCIQICQNIGYSTGRNVGSYSECNIPPEVPYTDNYGTNCCCVTISSGGDDSGTGDMDNDGIPDNEDDCPTQYGTKLNRGCPTITTTTTKLPLDTSTVIIRR